MISEAERQLVRWYNAKPKVLAGDGSWAIAIGYLIKKSQGGTVTPKFEAECKKTLEVMHVERLRELASEIARTA